MTELRIKTNRAFLPLLEPSRYKAAWGGRGSGKSHFFAEKLIEDSLCEPGLRSVCIREVQKTLKQSSKRLIEDKLEEFKLGESAGFKVFNEVIQTPGDGIISFQGMQDHNAQSIKSLEGFNRAWVEEAQTLSEVSLKLLRPTIRAKDSELWFGWNPDRKLAPVDMLFRGGTPPTGSIVVKANWSDNAMFPDVLEQERIDCLANDPDGYDHIWEGGYVEVVKGAYYASHLLAAKNEDRIGVIPTDPLMTINLFMDIGGTGAKSDAFSIWAVQFIGRQIFVLSYYEAQGQPIGTHLEWMRSKGYTPERAKVILPHDGSTNDKVYDVSYESAFKKAGYETIVVPNQGKGAAAARIEKTREVFSSCWFDKKECEGGLEALGWYHEKIDENRNIGLGPDHDWSSHGADAFGLMAVFHKLPANKPKKIKFQAWG